MKNFSVLNENFVNFNLLFYVSINIEFAFMYKKKPDILSKNIIRIFKNGKLVFAIDTSLKTKREMLRSGIGKIFCLFECRKLFVCLKLYP